MKRKKERISHRQHKHNKKKENATKKAKKTITCMSATECSFLVWGFQFTGVWDWIWNFQKVCMVNFSWLLLQVTRHSIAAWHKIEQVSDEMKYVWPTQWPERRWHFQTHGSMNVYTVWKKKLISGCGLERSVKRKKKEWFSPWQKSICPEREAGGVYGEESLRENKGQLETTDTKCVFLCVCVLTTHIWSQYDQLKKFKRLRLL